jgi:DNA-binding transcriptional MocR family regulator
MFLHLLEPRDGTIMLACAAPVMPPPELVKAYSAMLPRLAAATGIGYHPTGLPELRQALADRYSQRGTPTRPEQILVTSGGQQALSLLARAFVAPGDPVLVEAPTYPGALEVFHEQAAKLHTLPVGMAGFEAAVRQRRPALAYVVPTFHNPTGAVLSPLQRQHLAVVAARAGVPLIEDEILTDLAFPETEPPSAGPDSVISIGSLSKVLWGGLRIGWVRADEPIISRLARFRAVHDLGGNVPAQLAATVIVAELDELRQRRAVQLNANHDLLVSALAEHLPDWIVPPVSGGQTLWIRLPYGDSASYAQVALREGVAVLPGDGLDASGGSRDRLRVHFQADITDLVAGVHRLASAWKAYRPPEQRVGHPPSLAI